MASTNYKTGIDVTFGGVEGTDWAEEYPYHNKFIFDEKIVYIKSATTISMSHNARNMNFAGPGTSSARQIVGVLGGGDIRYKIDRDRQYYKKWANTSSNSTPADQICNLYTVPITLATETYDGVTPVLGTTGGNGGSQSSKSAYYYRGILDTANVGSTGDEYHVFAFADDSNVACRAAGIGSSQYTDDGKLILFVVNPKTPCFTASVTGNGQFYTTPAKAYWTPKICAQTTYIAPGTGSVSITLHDINGNNVFWRIGGGAFTDAGSSTKVLTDADFADGSNTLQYYYAGNSAFTKTRIVVKNPAFPSAAEDHGNYLWVDSTGQDIVANRVTSDPYYSIYNGYRTSGSTSGQDNWDTWSGQGYRVNGNTAVGTIQGGSFSLKNAIVALFEGWTYTRSGAPKSFGQYAKEMIIENSCTICPVGFELSSSGDAPPGKEIIYRGYYDASPVLQDIFAYDIIVANFRSNQVAGGITAIEDYFVRDRLASFAYQGMMHGASMAGINTPGMWGGAKMITAQIIGIIMPEYSTPYYGTSGFGTVQTTYPLCPYESDEYTWKEALFDASAPKTAYPNLTWYTGISDNDPSSLFTSSNQSVGGNVYPLGTWNDKSAYMASGLMGRQLMVWSNMVYLWVGGYTDARFQIGLDTATKGPRPQFYGTKDFQTTSGSGIISNASPGVVTYANHNMNEGSPIFFGGAGLPAQLVAGTTYYVTQGTLSASQFVNAFQVAASYLGTPINTSGGSGTQTVSGWSSERLSMLGNLNVRWPFAATNATAWVQSLPPNDNNSDDKGLQDVAVFGFAWYDNTYYGDAVVPADPTTLVATAISSSAINLTWSDASSNELGFKVERSLTGTDGWFQIGTSPANVPAYSDSGLAAATAYYYRVKAYNAVGDSGYTNTSTTTTASPALMAGNIVGTAALLVAP